MAIVKSWASPNGAMLTLHKVLGVSFSKDMITLSVIVASWSSIESHVLNPNSPVWSSTLIVPAQYLRGSPAADIDAALLVDGPFAGGEVVVLPAGDSLETAKARKRSQIKADRLLADHDAFPHLGKLVACDQTSRSRLTAIHGIVLAKGALPMEFQGSWKTVDNEYIPITTLKEWHALVESAALQVMESFSRSETLKAAIAACVKVDQVEAIWWGMDLSALSLP